jgi:hypothetical protein
MPFQPETCAHCACTLTLTQHSFETKLSPPETVRQALLLGFAYGEQHISPPMCDECHAQLEAHREASRGPSQIQPQAATPQALPPQMQPPPKPRAAPQPESSQSK